MFIVVIGHAPSGLAFVGPFGTEAEANRWISVWKTVPGRDHIPVGPIKIEPPENNQAGANLAGRK